MYQIGDALPFEAQFKESKLGKTGLSVTVDVYRGASLVVSGGTATELALGWYFYLMSSALNTVAGQYRCVFMTATTSVDDQQIPSLQEVGSVWVERLDDEITSRGTADPGDAMSLGAAAINAATFASDVNTYQAKVELFDDDQNATDRYVVAWFKNTQPITSGITVPTIQVVKVADGLDLIAATALTQIAALGLYRYTATLTQRITSGLAYYAHVTATIDGATRVWNQPIGRDSA